MVEFGDELIMESCKIPWLIWIQLLVTILLFVILFFGFNNVFASEPSPTTSAAASVALPPSGRSAAPPAHLDSAAATSRIVNVDDQRASRGDVTNGGSIREDNRRSGEGSSLKDPVFSSIFRRPNHPCSYIGIAKRALFKCFGLDSSSENSSSHQHEKHE